MKCVKWKMTWDDRFFFSQFRVGLSLRIGAVHVATWKSNFTVSSGIWKIHFYVHSNFIPAAGVLGSFLTCHCIYETVLCHFMFCLKSQQSDMRVAIWKYFCLLHSPPRQTSFSSKLSQFWSFFKVTVSQSHCATLTVNTVRRMENFYNCILWNDSW